MCNYKKILVLCIDNKIGDTVIESFLFRELKKLFKDVSIGVAIAKPYAPLLDNNPYIDEIIYLPRRFKFFSFFTALTIRNKNYDLLITTGKTFKRKLFYNLLGIKNMAFFTYPKDKPMRFAYANLLTTLGAKEVEDNYEIFLPAKQIDTAQEFLKAHNIEDKKIIVINPLASMKERSLSKQKTMELLGKIQKYIQKGYALILLDFKNNFPKIENVNICRITDILVVAALIKQASFVLTVDTSTLHIADVWDKQILALYASDDVNEEKYKLKNNFLLFGSKNKETKVIKSADIVQNIDIKDIISVLDTML